MARIRQQRNLYTVFVLKPRDTITDYQPYQIYKNTAGLTGLGLRKKEGVDSLGSTGSENCPMVFFFCGYDNGNSGLIKAGNFVDN